MYDLSPCSQSQCYLFAEKHNREQQHSLFHSQIIFNHLSHKIPIGNLSSGPSSSSKQRLIENSINVSPKDNTFNHIEWGKACSDGKGTPAPNFQWQVCVPVGRVPLVSRSKERLWVFALATKISVAAEFPPFRMTCHLNPGKPKGVLGVKPSEDQGWACCADSVFPICWRICKSYMPPLPLLRCLKHYSVSREKSMD